MSIRSVVPVLLVVLVAACGSGTASSPAPSAIGSPAATGQPAATNEPAGNGKVDCAKVKTAATNLLMIQFLAQLRTPDSVEQIRTKQFGNLDVDAFLAAMHDLHALDSYPSALGDPKAAIDFYESAGKAAQALLANDPVTQAAIDAYTQKIGTTPQFLSHQAEIAGAMDAAGC
jgi:hypothetical protein